MRFCYRKSLLLIVQLAILWYYKWVSCFIILFLSCAGVDKRKDDGLWIGTLLLPLFTITFHWVWCSHRSYQTFQFWATTCLSVISIAMRQSWLSFLLLYKWSDAENRLHLQALLMPFLSFLSHSNCIASFQQTVGLLLYWSQCLESYWWFLLLFYCLKGSCGLFPQMFLC